MPSPTGEAQVTLQATKALPYQPFGFGNWGSLFPPMGTFSWTRKQICLGFISGTSFVNKWLMKDNGILIRNVLRGHHRDYRTYFHCQQMTNRIKDSMFGVQKQQLLFTSYIWANVSQRLRSDSVTETLAIFVCWKQQMFPFDTHVSLTERQMIISQRNNHCYFFTAT